MRLVQSALKRKIDLFFLQINTSWLLIEMTDTYLNYFRVIVSQFVQFRGSKRNKNVKDKKGSKLRLWVVTSSEFQLEHNQNLNTMTRWRYCKQQIDGEIKYASKCLI